MFAGPNMPRAPDNEEEGGERTRGDEAREREDFVPSIESGGGDESTAACPEYDGGGSTGEVWAPRSPPSAASVPCSCIITMEGIDVSR